MTATAPKLVPASDTPRHSDNEARGSSSLAQLMERAPLTTDERLANSHLFVRRQALSRMLTLDTIYREILEIPGCIIQCGVRYGGDLVTLSSLRGIHEPYNYSRRIIGFDTFTGLEGTSEADHGSAHVADGQFGVADGHEAYLAELLEAHAQNSPLAHVQRQDLIKGDATKTVPKFLEENPGEQIAMLYLDMDIYAPTKAALAAAVDRLVPGSVVVFDEFGDARFPGEARAYREVLAGRKHRMKRAKTSTVTAYAVIEE